MVKRFALYFAAAGYVLAVVWYGFARSPSMPPSIFYLSQDSTFIFPHDVHPGAVATLFFLAPIQGLVYGVLGLLVGLIWRSVARLMAPAFGSHHRGGIERPGRARAVPMWQLPLAATVSFLLMTLLNWYEVMVMGSRFTWAEASAIEGVIAVWAALFTAVFYLALKYGLD